MRHIDGKVTIEEKNNILSEFMNSLRISGYNEEFRYNMMKGILEREIECEMLISKGERVRYRSGDQIRNQKNTNWDHQTILGI